jgi:hypothetical protein
MLDAAALRGLLSKKAVMGLSGRRTCSIVDADRR